jgi:hypothetical protein
VSGETCRKGHPVDRSHRGKWVCRQCHRDESRERWQILSDAARHLGLTQAQYIATYGKSAKTARTVLEGPAAPPRPDQCRRGHPRTPENTGYKQGPNGETRYCTACRRDREAEVWSGIADAAEKAGMSASEWIRLHGRSRGSVPTPRSSPDRPPDPNGAGSRYDRARRTRAAVRADALATSTHVAHLDPDQRDWDGLSVLAVCSCGWRETHPNPWDARSALNTHTMNRPDSQVVRGDRVDRRWQETA